MNAAVRKAIRDIAKAYECDTWNIVVDFRDHGPKGDTWGITISTMPRDKRMRSPETHVSGDTFTEARKKALAEAQFHYELPSVRDERMRQREIGAMFDEIERRRGRDQ